MDRRTFLHKTVFGAAAAAGTMALGSRFALGAGDDARGKKLNVLFIAVDDLRPQLGCYGHKQMISPNIDTLAARGVLFERTYCQTPVCGASRASLLSGLYPKGGRFQAWNARVDKDTPDVPTLPQHFKENGYHTLANGKIYHFKNDSHDKSWSEPHWGPPAGWPGYLTDPAKQQQRGKHYGAAYEAADCEDHQYPDGQIANKTIQDIARLAKGDKPFFLACGLTKPHLPFLAPKKYWDLYDPAKLDLADNPFAPKDAPRQSLHNWGELRDYSGIPKRGDLPKGMDRILVHAYYACVSYIDAQVGKIMAALDASGIADNTVVILWGDHGWSLGEHGLWAKHCNYDTCLHAPMMVVAPGVKAGQRTNALTEFVDIYPSLCDVAGIPQAKHLEGTSFVPLLQDPDRQWKQAIFSRYYGHSRGGDTARNDRFSYTEYQYRAKPEQRVVARMLYDHKTDPKENVNIVDDPKHAEVVKELSALLEGDGFHWEKVLPKGVAPPPGLKKQ